jgi:hypothetical protein
MESFKPCILRNRESPLGRVAGTLWTAYNGIAEMVNHPKMKLTPRQ